LNQVCSRLGIPFNFLAATEKDHIYRKPRPGMWYLFNERLNQSQNIDLDKSFYVGDAAGRVANWKLNIPKDFNDTDRKFAMNLSIQFFTPQEYFLSKPQAPFELSFDPKKYLESVPCLYTSETAQLVSSEQEIILFVGPPASGKTTFYQTYLSSHQYKHVNLDTMKSTSKCLSSVSTFINEKKSIVVDNTNPDIETRKSYIRIAVSRKVPIRCFWFDMSQSLVEHNNAYRSSQGGVRVPTVAFNTYWKKFKEPTLNEGFTEILKIGFVPNFSTIEEKRKWCEFWT